MTAQWGVIDAASITEARALIGTPLRRDRMQWVAEATRDAVRQFCLGVGDDNPRWADGGPAPPSFLYAVDFTIVAPKLPGVQWIYAGTRWRWFDLIRVGDRFESAASLTRVDEKTGRRFGTWVLQTGEVSYRRADGTLVGVAEGRVARTPRQRGGSGTSNTTTEVGPADIGPDTFAPARRGTETRFWEDVTVGDTLGPVIRPLSIEDIYRWYAGAQGALHYGGAHGDAVRYRHRHDDFEINPETGAKDFAARGHFSARQGRDVGMGGAYDVGPHRIAWLIAMLTDWLGDAGFLAELDVDVLRPNLVGDTTEFSGAVTTRWHDQAALIAIDLTGHNQRGELTTRGSATAALPSRDAGPVPLPLLGTLSPPES
jgi:acyl dehydratase